MNVCKCRLLLFGLFLLPHAKCNQELTINNLILKIIGVCAPLQKLILKNITPFQFDSLDKKLCNLYGVQNILSLVILIHDLTINEMEIKFNLVSFYNGDDGTPSSSLRTILVI